LFNGLITFGGLDATTQASFEQSRSQAIVYGLNSNAGGVNIASDVVAVSSQCTCTNNGPVCEGGLFGNLRVGGSPVAITGEINQRENLGMGIFIVINEQIQSGSGNARAITVNGLRVIFPGADELVVSSAHSGIVCATDTVQEASPEQ